VRGIGDERQGARDDAGHGFRGAKRRGDDESDAEGTPPSPRVPTTVPVPLHHVTLASSAVPAKKCPRLARRDGCDSGVFDSSDNSEDVTVFVSWQPGALPQCGAYTVRFDADEDF
jgi:hypothetical protein